MNLFSCPETLQYGSRPLNNVVSVNEETSLGDSQISIY